MGIILALGLAALIGGVGISSRPPLEALLIGAKRIFVASVILFGLLIGLVVLAGILGQQNAAKQQQNCIAHASCKGKPCDACPRPQPRTLSTEAGKVR
jgi:hypothetical protein